MNPTLVDQIADAVLYEGYILYPYRPSVKNRQRWTFGGLYPQSYSLAQDGTDAWTMQTECLVAGVRPTVAVRVRFLHLVARLVGELTPPLAEFPDACEPPFRVVEALRVGEKLYYTWQEAVEREVLLDPMDASDLVAHPRQQAFCFPARREYESLRDFAGLFVGAIVREQQAIEGSVELTAESVGDKLFKVTIRVSNCTPLEDAGRKSRDEALMRSLVSTHTILAANGGEFVSLIDPPEPWAAIATGCRNIGTWPVLVGQEGEKDTMLSSPIILYDYPQIAPESHGELFDSTEIDEILTLRIMTLTEEERRAMAAVDERGRALLDRTDALTREQLWALHGTLRSPRH